MLGLDDFVDDANNDIKAIVRVGPEVNLGAESEGLGGVSLRHAMSDGVKLDSRRSPLRVALR